MKKLKFRTNAKCGGCTAKIDAELSKILPGDSWGFDLASPDKTLTVRTGAADEKALAGAIVQAVQAAGYRAEFLGTDI